LKKGFGNYPQNKYVSTKAGNINNMDFLNVRSVDGFTKIHHICIDREGDRISEVLF
jgi:hypothetical protein